MCDFSKDLITKDIVRRRNPCSNQIAALCSRREVLQLKQCLRLRSTLALLIQIQIHMNHSNYFPGEICSFTRTDNIKTLHFVSMRIINAIASHWVWSIGWLFPRNVGVATFCGLFCRCYLGTQRPPFDCRCDSLRHIPIPDGSWYLLVPSNTSHLPSGISVP